MWLPLVFRWIKPTASASRMSSLNLRFVGEVSALVYSRSILPIALIWYQIRYRLALLSVVDSVSQGISNNNGEIHDKNNAYVLENVWFFGSALSFLINAGDWLAVFFQQVLERFLHEVIEPNLLLNSQYFEAFYEIGVQSCGVRFSFGYHAGNPTKRRD